MLVPVQQRHVGSNGSRAPVGAGRRGRVPPALRHKVSGPYKEMTWGPPVKYVKIPHGEAGTRATLKIMKQLVLSPWGHRNPEVVWLARQIAEDVSPGPTKDYRAQAEAILRFMKKHVDYRLDPAGLEYVPTPWYTLLVSGKEDCFVQGTLVLHKSRGLVKIEDLVVGDAIWGLDRWSTVTNVWGDKGALNTFKFYLSNGASMRLTPNHKVWVPGLDGEPKRVRAYELEPRSSIYQPAADAVTSVHRRTVGRLEVTKVERDFKEESCFDIETDDHRVWLPEADWTVSQCDGHATAIAALAMALGMKAGFRTVKGDSSRPDQWSHVYAVIGVTENGKTKWLTADSTQKESSIGWDPPEGKLLGMKTWVIDPSLEDSQWDA